jgi:hypothetical protein
MRDNPITLHPGTLPTKPLTSTSTKAAIPSAELAVGQLPSTPLFTGLAVLQIQPKAIRFGYKKKKGSSDTAHTKDTFS